MYEPSFEFPQGGEGVLRKIHSVGKLPKVYGATDWYQVVFTVAPQIHECTLGRELETLI